MAIAVGSQHNAIEMEKTMFARANSAEEYRNLFTRVITAMRSKYAILAPICFGCELFE